MHHNPFVTIFLSLCTTAVFALPELFSPNDPSWRPWDIPPTSPPSDDWPLPLITQTKDSNDPLLVDLGYAQYQGFQETSDPRMNAWMGIRYAAPPTGEQRWRPPQPPASNGNKIINASIAAPRCPQSNDSPAPDNYYYMGDEDCLFLNVFAPQGAKNLPVFVLIHGGGYGGGAAANNLDQLTQVNDYGFVSVAIQYRLEAFGFLSGTTVQTEGTSNAGLFDQHFALQWVQQHIAKFGGDPRQVTIGGQSAGAGSVEMQAMAYGGTQGTRYFDKGIGASPYTPVVYNFYDKVPTQRYLRFAREAGCYNGDTTFLGSLNPAILACLRSANTTVLQTANYNVGGGVNYGSWAFVPVVDGLFIQERPSVQLPSGRVNGRYMLSAHNSNEGAQFVEPNITTAQDFNNWLYSEYPNLNNADINQINNVYYKYQNESNVPFATCGNCKGPTAVNVGSFAVGNQQRAVEFYGEATIMCPNLWLSGAYQGRGRAGYVYFFDIAPGQHGLDQVVESIIDYPNFLVPEIYGDLHLAITTAWGNFIKTGNPSISNVLANGNSTGNSSSNPTSHWPKFTLSGPNSYQAINVNETGGVLITGVFGQPQVGGYPPATSYAPPGTINDFTQVDAYSWEGGLGHRCDFLRRIGPRIPV